jgi:hypothetical protein
VRDVKPRAEATEISTRQTAHGDRLKDVRDVQFRPIEDVTEAPEIDIGNTLEWYRIDVSFPIRSMLLRCKTPQSDQTAFVVHEYRSDAVCRRLASVVRRIQGRPITV